MLRIWCKKVEALKVIRKMMAAEKLDSRGMRNMYCMFCNAEFGKRKGCVDLFMLALFGFLIMQTMELVLALVGSADLIQS